MRKPSASTKPSRNAITASPTTEFRPFYNSCARHAARTCGRAGPVALRRGRGGATLAAWTAEAGETRDVAESGRDQRRQELQPADRVDPRARPGEDHGHLLQDGAER